MCSVPKPTACTGMGSAGLNLAVAASTEGRRGAEFARLVWGCGGSCQHTWPRTWRRAGEHYPPVWSCSPETLSVLAASCPTYFNILHAALASPPVVPVQVRSSRTNGPVEFLHLVGTVALARQWLGKASWEARQLASALADLTRLGGSPPRVGRGHVARALPPLALRTQRFQESIREGVGPSVRTLVCGKQKKVAQFYQKRL